MPKFIVSFWEFGPWGSTKPYKTMFKYENIDACTDNNCMPVFHPHDLRMDLPNFKFSKKQGSEVIGAIDRSP